MSDYGIYSMCYNNMLCYIGGTKGGHLCVMLHMSYYGAMLHMSYYGAMLHMSYYGVM